MKIKLDENIGQRGASFLRGRGHDVATVLEQRLGGAPDDVLFRVCAEEGRTLITLDHDFGSVLRFPPAKAAAIVILEPGRDLTLESLTDRIAEFEQLSRSRSPAGELWIVEPGRVRIYTPAPWPPALTLSAPEPT